MLVHYKTVCHFEMLINLITASKGGNREVEMAGMLSSCKQFGKHIIYT